MWCSLSLSGCGQRFSPTVFGVATAVKRAELPSPSDACGILVFTYCDCLVIIYSSLLQLLTACVNIVCVRGPKQVGRYTSFCRHGDQKCRPVYSSQTRTEDKVCSCTVRRRSEQNRVPKASPPPCFLNCCWVTALPLILLPYLSCYKPLSHRDVWLATNRCPIPQPNCDVSLTSSHVPSSNLTVTCVLLQTTVPSSSQWRLSCYRPLSHFPT